tara:strand:+ start:63 stop:287 length:225 start_codon:yes stop_codon:yes gene_type:complete
MLFKQIKKHAQIVSNDYASKLISVLLEPKITMMEKMVAVMIWTHLFINDILNIVIGDEQQIFAGVYTINEILNI